MSQVKQSESSPCKPAKPTLSKEETLFSQISFGYRKTIVFMQMRQDEASKMHWNIREKYEQYIASSFSLNYFSADQ